MKEFDVKPHVVPLTTVVAAYCTTGDTAEAERVVRDMVSDYGVNPNERTFSHLIWVHGQREDAISVKQVASWMVDIGFQIDRGETKAALFRALQECGLGYNAVENIIQDVASGNIVSKRRQQTCGGRLYDRTAEGNLKNRKRLENDPLSSVAMTRGDKDRDRPTRHSDPSALFATCGRETGSRRGIRAVAWAACGSLRAHAALGQRRPRFLQSDF